MSCRSEIVYLGLGSNLGRRARALSLTAMRLGLVQGVQLVRLSAVYETDPWGVQDQPPFLNLVLAARIETSGVPPALSPQELLCRLKRLETALGREPSERWGPRAVDIDILLFGDRQVASPDLTIPHPRIHERQFVLIPLSEIAPDAEITPGLTAAALARPGEAGVQRIGPLATVLQAEMPC